MSLNRIKHLSWAFLKIVSYMSYVLLLRVEQFLYIFFWLARPSFPIDWTTILSCLIRCIYSFFLVAWSTVLFDWMLFMQAFSSKFILLTRPFTSPKKILVGKMFAMSASNIGVISLWLRLTKLELNFDIREIYIVLKSVMS